jgi:hypothetical protein
VIITSPSADRDGLYVQRALQALDGARAVNVLMRTGDRVQNDGVAAGTGAVVLVGTSGLDRRGVERLADYVRNGGGLLLAAGPGVTPELISAGFGDEMPRIRSRAAGSGAASLVASDTRHPALALFAERRGEGAGLRLRRAGAGGGRLWQGRVAVLASTWRPVERLRTAPSFVRWATVRWIGGASLARRASRDSRRWRAPTGLASSRCRRPGHPEARVAVNADLREFDPARHGRRVRGPRAARGWRERREPGGSRRVVMGSGGGLLLVAATLVAESLIA